MSQRQRSRQEFQNQKLLLFLINCLFDFSSSSSSSSSVHSVSKLCLNHCMHKSSSVDRVIASFILANYVSLMLPTSLQFLSQLLHLQSVWRRWLQAGLNEASRFSQCCLECESRIQQRRHDDERQSLCLPFTVSFRLLPVMYLSFTIDSHITHLFKPSSPSLGMRTQEKSRRNQNYDS